MFRHSNQQFRDLCPRAPAHRDCAQIRPRIAAFTFIEVLTVVLILGIASAIVMPQFTSRDDLDAASAARAVMADLLYAQNRAIATQKNQYVVFNVSAQSYSLYCGSSGPTTLLTHPVNDNNYTMTFGQTGPNNISSDVTVASVNFGGQTTVAFDEMGTPYSYNAGAATLLSQSGAIVLNCGTYSLTISVTQDTGEITVN
jgi:MSHA pilin protein MshC